MLEGGGGGGEGALGLVSPCLKILIKIKKNFLEVLSKGSLLIGFIKGLPFAYWICDHHQWIRRVVK